MSFPLNHIFQGHGSYNIEYKLSNYEYGNIINIIVSRGYFQQVVAMWIVVMTETLEVVMISLVMMVFGLALYAFGWA